MPPMVPMPYGNRSDELPRGLQDQSEIVRLVRVVEYSEVELPFQGNGRP